MDMYPQKTLPESLELWPWQSDRLDGSFTLESCELVLKFLVLRGPHLVARHGGLGLV